MQVVQAAQVVAHLRLSDLGHEGRRIESVVAEGCVLGLPGRGAQHPWIGPRSASGTHRAESTSAASQDQPPWTPAGPPIIVLHAEDAGELLTLQRAAYVTEAQAHADPNLPPLLETLAEVRADLRSDETTVLGIRDGGRLVATVRLRHDPAAPETAEIARLAVAPDRQGEGLGTRLLVAAEEHARPAVTTLALFTGENSHGQARDLGGLGSGRVVS